jgi:hypothetical protein
MTTYELNLKSAGRIAALLLAIALGPAFGQTRTVAAERYVFGRADLAVGDEPEGVAIGAFQTGGPMSFAAINWASGSVSVVLGNPDGTFQPAVNYPTGQSYAWNIITADFNGDHNLDLAAVSTSGAVSIFLGNGDGTFKPAVNYAVGAAAWALAAADFNHDGHLDLAVVNGGENTVSILLGNGDGTFQPQVTYATGQGPLTLAVGDFNGDGVPDLAVGNIYSGTISILLGNSNGTFQPQSEYEMGAIGYMVADDFNGDHKLDLAVLGPGSVVSILIGNGNGTFQPPVGYATGNGPTGLVSADFNGDGKLDLAVSNGADNTVSVLFGKGNGTFQKQAVYGTGFSPYGLAAGDLNGDGRLDLAIANSGTSTVTVLIGAGNGTFQTHADKATGAAPYNLASADFNGDGKPDLAVVNYGSDSVSILLNQGRGDFAAHVDYATGYVPYAVAIADFNQDSLPDLAVADSGSNAVSILLGKGNGTFQAQQEYPTGSYDVGVAVGDFNGDGNPDLVTSNDNNFLTNASSISILLGAGTGAFQPYVDYAAGLAPSWAATADFNGDGKLDLAVADFGYGETTATVSVLLGNGDGTFQPAATYDAGIGAYWVSVGDFNQDGKQDLAVVNLVSNTVSILLGNGDGTFQPHVDYPVGVYPSAVAIADFNGDGIPDLAVSNSFCATPCSPGTVSVLLGNGDGTFQPSVDYQAALGPGGVATADLSGEGGADLAVANYGSNSVSVLLNLPVISVFPNTVAFAKEAVGKKSAPKTITIGNPSGTPIGITSVKVAGADPGDFAETNTCPVLPAPLAPGATCSITVTFTPAASGKRSVKIEVTDTAPGSPQSIALSGSGR